MKDKNFDKPQMFDAEDEAFFQKHFGQWENNTTTENSAASGSGDASQRRGSQVSSQANQTTAAQQTSRRRRQFFDQDAPMNHPEMFDEQTSSSSATGTAASSQQTRSERARRRISPEEAQRIAAQQEASQKAAAQKRSSNRASYDPYPESTAGRKRNSSSGKHSRKKKKHPILRFIVCLLLIIAILAVGITTFGKQPIRETSGLGTRTDGISTFLIAGTDDEGYRTDTIILISINNNTHQARLMSIPRDTYIEAPSYNVPKINSALGYAGGGRKGMEELMDQVENLIGFMPDGYFMIDFNDFVSVVDFMGGVDFNVPMDMDYEDPTQDLEIHLKAGEQHLNGKESIQLVRFRSGYANADITRTSVQRDFIKAALEQWTAPSKIWKIPLLTIMISTRVTTDMSLGNLGWIAKAGILCNMEDLSMDILPGTPQYINGGSYYVPDDSAVRELMTGYSPYAN